MDFDTLSEIYKNDPVVLDLIDMLKQYYAKCIKDLPGTNCKAGLYYILDQNEAGLWIRDTNNNWIDAYEIPDFDKSFEPYGTLDSTLW